MYFIIDLDPLRKELFKFRVNIFSKMTTHLKFKPYESKKKKKKEWNKRVKI